MSSENMKKRCHHTVQKRTVQLICFKGSEYHLHKIRARSSIYDNTMEKIAAVENVLHIVTTIAIGMMMMM